MAGKLLAERYEHTGPAASTLSDPIADTPMVVTLDQLRPYDYNPRLTRNPLYDEIKASIRERGLDQPPAITRRPGEATYIIRSGGNTRLSILRELWAETKDEQFFRITCVFRPWSARGEVLALTGHLVENELHGRLTFIERALGIEKARELYEQEDNRALSQSELARRLTGDGYPIQQSHISRMRDAVQYMLPAIPRVLYGGLGRHQVERLAVLRRAGERLCQQHGDGTSTDDAYRHLWHEVLATFDGAVDDFAVQRVQDELVGRLAEQFGLDYDALSLALTEQEHRQRALSSEPVVATDHRGDTLTEPSETSTSAPAPTLQALSTPAAARRAPAASPSDKPELPPPSAGALRHARSADTTTSVSDASRSTLSRAEAPETDSSSITSEQQESLRTTIAQVARTIAEDVGQADQIEPTHDNLGFVCRLRQRSTVEYDLSFKSRTVPALLNALCAASPPPAPQAVAADDVRLADVFGTLLVGNPAAPDERLSDAGLDALFQLLRLARQLRALDPRADRTAHHRSP